MAQKLPGYIRKQLSIPGLECPVKALDPRPQTLREQVEALQNRLRHLELEVTLLRILLEEGVR